MKKFNFLGVSLVITCLFLFSGTHFRDSNNDFDVLPDGQVSEAHGLTFTSVSEYLGSNFFRQKGRRCGSEKTDRRIPENSAEITGVAGDCSRNLQVIRDAYWPSEIYFIPVVFHIIHKRDGTGNIPDSRITNQLDVLNADFRALPFTMGDLGFDTRIGFELAGITRTGNDKWFRDRGQEASYKIDLAWDTNYYLNVYVNSASGYLGYSTFPQDSAGDIFDGITMLYSVVGGRDEGCFPYHMGRPLVHEVGHYLGLEHTFSGGCCNGYTCGDLLADTAAEDTAHYGCTDSFSCNHFAPIHNYMNYTDDLCMNRFTPEQGNRMVCSLIHYRPTLYHTVSSIPGADIFVADISMQLHHQGKSWQARAVVTIMDTDGATISGAQVSARWDLTQGGGSSGTTGSDGTVTLVSPYTRKSNHVFTVTVTGVGHVQRTHNPELDIMTSASISN